MELYDYIEQFNLNDVSDVALLKQREKLNEEVFKDLNKPSLGDFYKLFPDEVKTFKGYILTAIDGSDCEVPILKSQGTNIKQKQEKTQEILQELNYQIVMMCWIIMY